MSEADAQQGFVDGLRQAWKTQVEREGAHPTYVFNGWEGDLYNVWLEHRHGWPVTSEGWCGPSSEMEVCYTDCPVCTDLTVQFMARGHR